MSAPRQDRPHGRVGVVDDNNEINLKRIKQQRGGFMYYEPEEVNERELSIYEKVEEYERGFLPNLSAEELEDYWLKVALRD